MKRILLLIFLLGIITTPAFALTINQDTTNGGRQVQYYEPLGQSFTATDIDIGYVGLYIKPYNSHHNDLTLTMSLYNGEGDFSSDALITSNNFTLASGYTGWLDLDVSTFCFTENSMYTIGIFNDTPQWGVDFNWRDNPYSGGVAYYRGAAHSNGDLRFHVGPGNVAPVPEPTSMLLLGTGLIGLASFGRKKLFRRH